MNQTPGATGASSPAKPPPAAKRLQGINPQTGFLITLLNTQKEELVLGEALIPPAGGSV